MGTQRKKSIQELKESPKILAKSIFTGTLKNRFIKDLEKGVDASDLLRTMAREYYDKIDNSTKHSY